MKAHKAEYTQEIHARTGLNSSSVIRRVSVSMRLHCFSFLSSSLDVPTRLRGPPLDLCITPL